MRLSLISITNLASDYVSFINQCYMVNFELSYDEYVIVEFGNNIQLINPTEDFLLSSSVISQQLSRLIILQMLVFWLRSKLLLYVNLKDRMKRLQTKVFETKMKEVSSVHEELWRNESELLKEYTYISDSRNYIEDYLKFERILQKDQFRKKTALPAEYFVSSETGEPLTMGIFEVITEEIEGGCSRVMKLYTLLKEQCNIVSGNLRDRINISLATSNIKLQKWLVIFTVILIFLSVILIVR